MKKLYQFFALIVFMICTTTISHAQSCLKWNKFIGGNDYNAESMGNVIALADGFLICGTANSSDPKFNVPSGNNNDAFIVKYSLNGDLIWKHTYGGTGEEGFKMIITTTDGGFIGIGHTSSNNGDVSGNHGDGDAWVVKTDAEGNLQWQKCYGGSRDDYGLVIVADPSGYTFSGAESSRDGSFENNFGDYDAWIVKISSTGNIVWQKNYGGSRFDEAGGLTRNDDGTYVFAGATTSNNHQVGNTHGGSYDTWVVKITGNGSIIWKKVYGGKGYDYCNGMTRTTDGNIVLGHGSNSAGGDVNGNGLFVAWLLKLNTQSGDIIWSRAFSGNGKEWGSFGIFSTSDGGVICLGAEGTVPYSNFDGLILAVDANGNKKWHKLLRGSNEDDTHAGTEINGGDLLILGYSVSVDGDFAGGNNNSGIWISKFENCSDNSLTKASPLKNQSNESVLYTLNNYPNPVSQSTTITYSVPQAGKVSLIIYDMMGRPIKTLVNTEVAAGTYNIQWNANDENRNTLSAGIYLLRLITGSYSETKKLSVIK